MTSIPIIDDLDRVHTNQELILGLTLSAEIIQFNSNLEQVTGFHRDEVLYKKFDETLLPTESIPLWNNLFDSMRQNMWIDEFVLPLKTKQNQPYMISWTGFFIKDEHGSFKDICLIGKPHVQKVMKTETLVDLPRKSPEPPKQDIFVEPPVAADVDEHVSRSEPILQVPTNEIPMRHGRNRMQFADGIKVDVVHDESERRHYHRKRMSAQTRDEPPSGTDGSSVESRTEPSGDYRSALKRLENLESKQKIKQKQGRFIGRHEAPSTEENKLRDVKQRERNKHNETLGNQGITNENFSFFSDPFGLKQQRQELMQREQQLDARSRQLDAVQSRLLKDQHLVAARVEEFSKWRQKLEQLELAIESRRQELMRQEAMVLQKSPPLKVQRLIQTESEPLNKSSMKGPQNDETLDKIPTSAAIIQRGILKQTNSLFLDLLGYTMEEIIDKSFFDFIALEGLADVEKYYLDRLKGDNVSTYKTIFMTKDDTRISAEVNIKQTIYNGEKAEIAIITCLNSNTP